MIDVILKGNSLGERHKHLNELVINAKPDALSSTEISWLADKSQVDKVYLVKVASRFKNPSVISELLKSEDSLVVSKVLKCSWFFEGIETKEIVNVDNVFQNIFPNVSYATKCKIITKLGTHLKDEAIAESFYSKLKHVNGSKFAFKLLPVCSEKFIEKEMDTSTVAIPPLQLKYIYKKYQSIVVKYIEKLLKSSENLLNYSGIGDYETIMIQILKDHRKIFQNLFSEYHEFMTFSFGYRSTLALLTENVDFIIENVHKVHRKLHARGVLDSLTANEFEKFIKKMFPEKLDIFPRDVLIYVKYWKPETAANYLLKICNTVYNTSLLNVDYIPKSYMENLPVELRAIWAKNMIEKDVKFEEYYIKYLPTDEAIKRYKELIQIAPLLNHRTAFLGRMVECCKINKDQKSLLSVIQYVLKRHRNDGEELRYSFLNNIQSLFKMHELSLECWKAIDEMLAIMYYNKEFEYRQYFLKIILEKKIHFNLLNNIEIDSVIDTMIKYQLNTLNMLTDNPEYERKILDVYFSKYKPMIVGKPIDDMVEAKILALLNSFVDWNAKHKAQKSSILECDWLVDAVRELFKANRNERRFVHILWGDPSARDLFIKDILKIEFNDNIMNYILNHDVSMIQGSLDLILSNTYNVNKYIHIHYYKKIQTYLYHPLGDFLKLKLISKIEENVDTDASSLSKWLIILSFLMKTADYEEYSKKFTPKSMKIDIVEIDEQKMKEYQVMEKVVENLKYINPPPSFDMVMEYAKDDYLKKILPSLLSVCFKKSETDTIEFIKQLAEKPVSVKKHSIRLSSFIFNKQMLPEFYDRIWKREKNNSVRDVIFQRSFNIFLTDTDSTTINTFWNSIKQYMESFDEKDRNLFYHFTKLNKVKSQFRVEYAEFCWNTLKKLQTENVNVVEHMCSLLDGITGFIDDMNEEFCDKLIKEYLNSITKETVISNKLLSFCVRYLIRTKSSEAQKKRIFEVCGIFKSFIVENWNVEIEKGYARNSVSVLISECCNQLHNDTFAVDPMPVLFGLEEMLCSSLPFGAVFQSHINLKLTMKTLPLKKIIEGDILGMNDSRLKDFLKAFAGITIEILKEIIEKYDSEIFNLFLMAFESYITNLFYMPLFEMIHNDSLKMLFVQELLNHGNRDKHVMILAIAFIPVENKSLLKKQLVDQIMSIANETVKIILYNRENVPSSIFMDAK